MAKTRRQALSTVGNATGDLGIVLSMDMVSTSTYGVAYTVPVQVGSSQQNLSLQVDTGSSDLWIASKACSSASCSATNGRLYDPSSSQPTSANFSIQYLSGAVDGPIVWDQVQIGDYIITNQALAAAATVNDEPLANNFDGILGFSLPSNSLILQAVPASTGGAPDGATLSSNLLSLASATDAQFQPFFSLTLARPGSSQIPSLLGIGRHPPEIISDPSRIRYSPVLNENTGPLFWKTTVHAITVYVDGRPHPVTLPSLSGATEPTALLDSGVPLIMTTPAIANGIYGALGIGPASDGNYYVPCSTPLNMTVTLEGQDEIPLHPLDLTTEPAGQSTSAYCMGLVQSDPSQLTADANIGDMILGVPFLRNVYTVMAYAPPDTAGAFNNSVPSGTYPMLGLLGLTNATLALEEFNQVRVDKQPLSSGSSQPSSSPSRDDAPLSVGVKILIGLVGFFALSLALFALRCVLVRRRWRNGGHERVEEGTVMKKEYDTFQTQSTPSEEDAHEFGMRTKCDDVLELCDPWDPHAGTWNDTIIGTDAGSTHYFPPPALGDGEPLSPPCGSPDLTSSLLAHDRSASEASDVAEFGMCSVGMAGIGTAARGSVIDAEFQQTRPSCDSARSCAPLRPTTSSLRSCDIDRTL